MKFADAVKLPLMTHQGPCDQCGTYTLVVYDLLTDKYWCSTECAAKGKAQAPEVPHERTEHSA